MSEKDEVVTKEMMTAFYERHSQDQESNERFIQVTSKLINHQSVFEDEKIKPAELGYLHDRYLQLQKRLITSNKNVSDILLLNKLKRLFRDVGMEWHPYMLSASTKKHTLFEQMHVSLKEGCHLLKEMISFDNKKTPKPKG